MALVDGGVLNNLPADVLVQQNRGSRTFHSSVADLIIEPDIAKVDAADIQHAVEIAALGQRVAFDILPTLREQLRRLDPLVFPQADTPA